MDRTDPHRSPAIRLTGTEQSEHDALAELFLGDAPFAPSPMFPRASDEAPRPRPTPGASRVEGRALRRPRAEAGVMPDGLPDGVGGRPVIELVILGHLPVRASLWVRQYACLSARKRCETVALVRAAGGAVAVDVVTGNEPPRIEAAGSIAEGVRAACLAATRVVLRVDETVEPELLWRDGVDEVTILTGADEAAVVASYRLIKSLAASLDDRWGDRLDPETAPALRVAVMGNPGPEIDAARHKIERACQAFLDHTIEVLDASGRIDATGTTAVCRSDSPDAGAQALDALLGVASGPAPLTLSTPSPGPLRLADPDAGAGAEPAFVPEVVLRPIGSGARAPVVVQMPEPRRVGEEVRGEVAEPTATAAAAAAAGVAGFRREPLACLIEGLEPIEARCPGALGVELACDGEGRLHAVTTDEGGAGEGVSRLLAATAWARANLALLIRAEPRISIPSSDPREGAEAFMHLLARRPSAARAVLDTEVRVYALASVDLDTEEIMVATLLNDC